MIQDMIAVDGTTHDSTFCPVILGSDKTTVSVATGQNEYYPLYQSNGLIHNGVRRAHRNGVALSGFLSIPKSKWRLSNDMCFTYKYQQIGSTTIAQNSVNSVDNSFMVLSIISFNHFARE